MRVVTPSLEAARVLRDAGVEVVLVGADITPAQLEATALQEDAVVVHGLEDVDGALEGRGD